MIAWKFSVQGEMRVRYAVTELDQEKSTGSAKAEIKAQLRLWF
jgi:hypothetical protein